MMRSDYAFAHLSPQCEIGLLLGVVDSIRPFTIVCWAWIFFSGGGGDDGKMDDECMLER